MNEVHLIIYTYRCKFLADNKKVPAR